VRASLFRVALSQPEKTVVTLLHIDRVQPARSARLRCVRQQAAYFDYALAHLGAWGVLNMIWYPLANNGWMCTDMVIHNEAMPVWYEYKKATG
jgi:hypothetical protein